MSTGRRRGVRLLIVVGVAMTGLLFTATPASAHAYLVASSPIDGAVWDDQPTEVLLEFSDAVTLPTDAVTVLDRTGSRVDHRPAVHGAAKSQVRVALPAEMAIGTYAVTWRAVSADSHPISGAFVFSVGEPGAVPPQAVPPPTEAGLAQVDVAVRTLWYVGALAAVGGLVFMGVMRYRHRLGIWRMTVLAAVVGLVATAASVPLQAGLVAGTWSSLLDGNAVLAVVSESFGAAAATRAGGLVLIILGVLAPHRRVGWWICSAGAAAVVVSVVLSGHAATTTPRLVATPAYLVHAAAAATWFGGLIALAVCLWRRRREGEATVTGMAVRYSALAAVAVTAIAVTGLTLAVTQVGSLAGLGSTYGVILLLKVGLVSAAGLIGWYNRARLISVLRRAPRHKHLMLLKRLVTIEAVVIGVVVAVTATLTAVEPPRAQAATTGPVDATRPIGDLTVDMSVEPARVGVNTVTLEFTDDDGRPADPGDEVTVEFSLPDRDITQISRTPESTGAGVYRYQGPELSMPGRWRVEVQIRTSDFILAAQYVEVPLV